MSFKAYVQEKNIRNPARAEELTTFFCKNSMGYPITIIDGQELMKTRETLVEIEKSWKRKQDKSSLCYERKTTSSLSFCSGIVEKNEQASAKIARGRRFCARSLVRFPRLSLSGKRGCSYSIWQGGSWYSLRQRSFFSWVLKKRNGWTTPSSSAWEDARSIRIWSGAMFNSRPVHVQMELNFSNCRFSVPRHQKLNSKPFNNRSQEL